MAGLVGKVGTAGLVGVASAIALRRTNTEGGEKRVNNFSTAAGLGALGGLAYAGKVLVKKNPQVVEKAALKTGTFIEKAIKFVADKAPIVLNKIKSNKFGKKALDVAAKVTKKAVNVVKNNSTLSKLANKATVAIKKFAGMSTAKKGKVGLIAAGVALLATLGLNLVKNHYKKEGAIEQKYDVLRADYEQMLATNPIMNGQTGEPISFDDYCKVAQTYVK